MYIFVFLFVVGTERYRWFNMLRMKCLLIWAFGTKLAEWKLISIRATFVVALARVFFFCIFSSGFGKAITFAMVKRKDYSHLINTIFKHWISRAVAVDMYVVCCCVRNVEASVYLIKMYCFAPWTRKLWSDFRSCPIRIVNRLRLLCNKRGTKKINWMILIWMPQHH